MDLICFCHIPWNFVYQRPQHLLTRFSHYHRVFVIQEPVYNQPETGYEVQCDRENENLFIVSLKVSGEDTRKSGENAIKNMLNSLIEIYLVKEYMLWYYSPMALSYSDHLVPSLTIYDCMDELSAFKFAPPEIRQKETELFAKADVVFTGGQSLYEAKKNLHANIHAFPSSIDKSHFSKARVASDDPVDQASIPFPRFGFYGVVDERFHISLLDEIAMLKPEWHFIIIGPVVKIDPATLPRRSNIHYLGSKTYNELPAYLGKWDVAFLPFALNESTQFISPTKTPEYLAGGKPVISTSITDVVNPYGTMELVKIADNAEEFIAAAEAIFKEEDKSEWLKKTDEFLAGNSWNKTWHKMNSIIEYTLGKKKNKNPKILKSYV